MAYKPWGVRVYFEPRDCWIGVFWTFDDALHITSELNVYICLVPCLPIHIRRTWTRL